MFLTRWFALIDATHPVLANRIKSLRAGLLRFAKEHEGTTSVADEVPKKLVKQANEVIEAYTDALDTGPSLPEPLFDIFKMACRFVAISDLYSEHHKVVTRTEKAARQSNVIVNLKCLDAATFLKPQYKLFRSSVVFSATLRPAPFYRDALGMAEDTQRLTIGSPFSSDQVKHCVVSHINTRYHYRQESLPELISLLKVMVKSKPGNYMVFFPSYAYLEQAHKAFKKKWPNIETWEQVRQSDVDERNRQLNKLDSDGTRLGFAILGGVFGEGIDYVGDKLIGVAVVGVGLPGIGVEQDLIADCYRDQGLDGFDYAYRYPGFTKVLQTAGRVIRTERDRGVVFLIDDRFNQAFYRDLYPVHWELETANSVEEIDRSLNAFWQSQSQLALT